MITIKIDEEKCKRGKVPCEVCVDSCPIPCYKVDRETGNVSIVNLEECLVCKNCEETCPAKAITVELTDRFYSDSTW